MSESEVYKRQIMTIPALYGLSRNSMKTEVEISPYFYRIASRVLCSALYQAFEQFGAL